MEPSGPPRKHPVKSLSGKREAPQTPEHAGALNYTPDCEEPLSGSIVWISDPVAGSHHDSYCLAESGALVGLDPSNSIGDKGYVETGMITPIKRPPKRSRKKLLDWQKEFNKQVNKIRWRIEQVIANFKTWRIMHTDYRRPIDTFPTTIKAVIALHFYATA